MSRPSLLVVQVFLSDLSSIVKACPAQIDAAALLFRRQGYAATGVNQILQTADVKAGSLYHHFPNGKQELAAAVVASAGRDIEHLLRRFLDNDLAVADIVDAWIDLMSAGLSS